MTAHHILVPIDFSPYAEQALDYAIALAQKLQARVTLLHVIQSPLVAGADMGVWPSPAFIDDLETAITSDMENYLARVTAAGLAGEIAFLGTEDPEVALLITTHTTGDTIHAHTATPDGSCTISPHPDSLPPGSSSGGGQRSTWEYPNHYARVLPGPGQRLSLES
jgi:nucleotide-binding universal stress UspA family protein